MSCPQRHWWPQLSRERREGKCSSVSESEMRSLAPSSIGPASKPCMRRELAPVDAAALGARTLPVQSSWPVLSSDEQLLAVCEASCVGVHSLHALLGGHSMAPAPLWHLPGGASLKQVGVLDLLLFECSQPTRLTSTSLACPPPVCLAAGVAAGRAAGGAGDHIRRAAPAGQPGQPADRDSAERGMRSLVRRWRNARSCLVRARPDHSAQRSLQRSLLCARGVQGVPGMCQNSYELSVPAGQALSSACHLRRMPKSWMRTCPSLP